MVKTEYPAAKTKTGIYLSAAAPGKDADHALLFMETEYLSPEPGGIYQAQLNPEDPPQPVEFTGPGIPPLNPPRLLELLQENMENCFLTSSDPQDGHFTSFTLREDKTKSSKFLLHLLHVNSYMGIICYLDSVDFDKPEKIGLYKE